ncbi:hypothetical protein [Tenacibaculum sp. 190524A05c]|uniref:hypothetical protein n=1 Tax=Tenacibaculum platacis TaxID=3137852 RepID=UPI0032B14318
MILAILVSFPEVIQLYTQYGYNEIIDVKAQYSIFFLIISTVVYQYASLFLLRLLEPVGKINLTIKYQAIGELLTLLVTGLVIYFTKSIFNTCLVMFIMNIFYCIYLYFYVRKELPFSLFMTKGFSIVQGLKIIKESFLLSISFVIEKVYEIGLNLFVAKLFSPTVLTMFSTNRVMSNASVKVSNIITIPLLPDMQKQFALKDKTGIILKMKKFWNVTSLLIVVFLVLVLPFIEPLFNIWTRGEIEYNNKLVVYMFIAIVFQNYSTIIVELMKKTNLSIEILIYNLVKVLVIICMFYFSSMNSFIEGLGLSLFVGELVSLFLISYILYKRVINFMFFKEFLKTIFPLLLFASSMLIYAEINDYYFLFVFNLVVIFLFNRKRILRYVFNL